MPLPSTLSGIECGNPSCQKSNEDLTLRACSKCRAKRYCSRECQVADWKVHKLMCSRKIAIPVPWENAIREFNDSFGSYVGSYGVGAVFKACSIGLSGRLTGRLSEEDWKAIWLSYACVVVLNVREESRDASGVNYTAKFVRVYAGKVDEELPEVRRHGYRTSIRARDWPMGLIYKVVSPDTEAVMSATVIVRSFKEEDILPPIFYVVNMTGVARLLEFL